MGIVKQETLFCIVSLRERKKERKKKKKREIAGYKYKYAGAQAIPRDVCYFSVTVEQSHSQCCG